MKPLKTFIIYSSKDKDLRIELENHLRPLADMGWLELWSDKEILPGEHWDAAIKKQLAETQLFLMLVSVDFYNSGYIREAEFKTAIEKLKNGAALVIPIIIRHCTWKYFPVIKDLQVLPPGGIAVTDLDHWKYRDKAWDAVVTRIGERVLALQAGKPEPQPGATAKPEKTAPPAKTKPRFENGKTLRDLTLSPVMVFVEGGTFEMGSHENESEQPIHTVTVPSFWIGRYPVTFEEYDRFCEETGREKPKDEGWGRGRRPAINVSWEDTLAYCEWLSVRTGKNYRLPSEAEWEFAARGGTLSKGYKFAGGNDLIRVAWYRDNSDNKTQPVGRKAANELGLHDMSGNVYEWCEDHWHGNYEGAPLDGSAWVGQEPGAPRVLRGGGWGRDERYCRVANRNYVEPADRFYDFGFRLALQADG